MTKRAIALTEGAAEGRALVLAEPLSFWGGVDSASGRIIDRSGGSVELIDDIPGLVHGFPSVEVQDAFFDRAVDWITRTVPGNRAGAAA